MGFIADLIIGELFSENLSVILEKSKRYVQSKDLSSILDEYHNGFINYKDTEISLSNCDMGAVFKKRKFLKSCALDYITKNNSDLTKNVKQEFIDTACKEIGDSSEVIKTYLDRFYLLVFTKEVQEVPDGIKALVNAYADSQHEINEKQHKINERQREINERQREINEKQRERDEKTEKRLSNLDEDMGGIKETLGQIQDEKIAPVDFTPYYQIVKESFTEEKEESIVGNESDDNAYIDAYIETRNGSVPVLDYLEEWVEGKKPGAILIHGEPGHGKTMLCRKAMVEFFRGGYLQDKVNNVIAVSLNTGENRSIISEGRVLISNALAWGAEQEHRFSFEDCRESLLFLDGFDEFIDDAKRTEENFGNICFFMKKVNKFAKTYDIHIVVLSRSVAVEKDLKKLTRICNHFQLSPLSKMQQDKWLKCHPVYYGYKETLKKIRKKRDMDVLLEVPFLFRLIVHNQFDGNSSNVVELYNDLFISLMDKRNIYNDIEVYSVEKELMNLAYEIYCTDSNMAVLENVIEDPHWLFTFYVQTSGNGKIKFFHNSFYQYYLAKYIYTGVINLKDKEEENFIGLFAERELDDTIRKYLSYLFNKKDRAIVYSNVERMMIGLARSKAHLNDKPHVDSGDAERSRFLRSQNIYRNTLHIAAALSYVIPFPFNGKLDFLMRTYKSRNIVLVSRIDKMADLSGTNLFKADLNEAYLFRVDLTRANLRRADLSFASLEGASLFKAVLRETRLRGAYLRRADLSGADLRRADLSEAYLRGANLSGANLSGANLKMAQLNDADLSGAILSRVDLSVAILSGANLSGATLSGTDLKCVALDEAKIDVKYKGIIDPLNPLIKGYSSIEWVSDEGDEH